MFLYLIQGLTLGLSAAATPGPFQAFLLNQSIQKGWRRSLPAAFSPLLSDGPIIALTLVVIAALPAWFHDVLRLAGGMLLGYLAWSAFRAVKSADGAAASPTEDFGSLLKAVGINLLNPNPYIFWSLIGAPVLLECWQKGFLYCLAFLGGLYGAFICACATLIILVALAAGLEQKTHRALLYVSSAALALFALWQLTGAARGILHMLCINDWKS